MNVVVLVKPTPDVSKSRVSRSQGTLVFEGTPILNPIDLEALECALKIKEQDPSAVVTTLTLAPAVFEGTVKKTIGMGADAAILIDSTDVADDPWVRAQALCSSASLLKPDLILAGSGGTVPYAVAEFLKMPSLAGIKEVGELSKKPALACVAPGIWKPRAATLAGIGRAAKIPIQKQAAKINTPLSTVKVLRQFLPDPDFVSSRLATSTLQELPPPEWSGILVVADAQGARLTATSSGTLALASEVAQLLGARVTVMLTSAEAADRAIRYGADEVKVCSPENLVDKLTEMVEQEHPEAIFWDDQPQHRKTAGTLSARLKTGCAVGAVHAALDAESRHLVLTQSLYEGKLQQEILIPTRPQLVTVTPTAQVPPVPDAARTGKVVTL